ncbi:carbohydrate-binding family 9-like protein [Mucilaginibacter gynuensis]|uniref:Carbohydrate-binding family 9-like protein n=1 Tax=Mucilaginibacter gynuensis TaxID=1302236 RepID=A0ABP8FY22_9SPHI
MTIPHLNTDNVQAYRLIDHVSASLDQYPAQQIINSPWAADEAAVQASFSLAYNDDYLFLKYYVTEQSISAKYNKLNDPVYKDSCVEFFIAFDNDTRYYNLEFNCAGNCLAQYGEGKTDRVFISGAILKSINHQAQLKTNAFSGLVDWQLTLCIPKSVFCFHPGLQLSQTKARVNVYKCGDDLPVPHYLCWNNIEATQPNFHLSGFFKEIKFNPKTTAISTY